MAATRNLKLDNAKGVLIFLVLIAHFSELAGGWSSPGRTFVLDIINVFTMPAFVFLAGVTSRPKDIVRRLLILGSMLAVFQVIYQAQEFAIHRSFEGSILQPFWLLWFLMVMIWYTMLTPLIARTPPLLAMGVSVALALGAGLLPLIDGRLSGSRALVFLPFFVGGFLYGPKLLNKEFPKLARPIALATILTMASLLFLADLPHQWVHATRGYDWLKVDPLTGMGIRLTLIIAAAIGTVAFVAAMPSTSTILTTAGRTSLSVFLLHGLIVRGLASTFSRFDHLGDWLLLPVLALSVALIPILGREGPDRVIRNAAAACANTAFAMWARVTKRKQPVIVQT